VSTRFQAPARVPGGIWPGSATGELGRDATEEVALVAQAVRSRLLSVHRHRLSFQDLEDCYSQATVELVAQARRGALRYSSRAHLRNTLELRFTSRIVDRRRALSGRSPAQAILDGAMSLGGVGEREIELPDRSADVERRMMLRHDLLSVERAAHGLTPDQRLVLACQIGLQMGAGEFCRTFDWSLEKHRKVAQRARLRLRQLLDESAGGGQAPVVEGLDEAAREEEVRDRRDRAARDEAVRGEAEHGDAARGDEGFAGSQIAQEKTFREECPVLRSGSGERTGTHL
jgi:DNA-directed RNA polymerase specialized sigma24 family protein